VSAHIDQGFLYGIGRRTPPRQGFAPAQCLEGRQIDLPTKRLFEVPSKRNELKTEWAYGLHKKIDVAAGPSLTPRE
jgi:hypothetical protein